jgi:hypothetical protein
MTKTTETLIMFKVSSITYPNFSFSFYIERIITNKYLNINSLNFKQSGLKFSTVGKQILSHQLYQ